MAQQTATGAEVDQAEHAARLSRLEALYGHLEAAVLDLEGQVGPSGAAGAPGPGQDPPEPSYPDVQSWVEQWFAPIFGRRLGATHWCARWWAHDEAVFRLEAMWRSWETLRLDGSMGMATWIRDHLDTGRRELLGADGPFQACDGDGHDAHNPPPALPVIPTPPGWPGEPERSEP